MFQPTHRSPRFLCVRACAQGLGLVIESDVRRHPMPAQRQTHTRMPHSPSPDALPTPSSSQQFYATEAGRQHFADQLTSIRYCVQEVTSRPFEITRHCATTLNLHAHAVSFVPTALVVPSQTCNFDALYAYLTCTNYDFNCETLRSSKHHLQSL